ncbi:PR-1-like protein [Rozella allomycis CSF55]|uniref:PR-1-like protein n=1 Tax=Rozella allomycis (strain CSF55) TaxID=988480 RepID=A0A075B259_ROZAC|nr:hypothetical protein O9G_001579 [Rozella allomycis CSF55]RKP16680.1 PR-1-like protein [Rozella allomycis CSF55]|eukprot:EPZ36595.1 hypothetical protein O9G_001579 [Rozella allomycis CSF55]
MIIIDSYKNNPGYFYRKHPLIQLERIPTLFYYSKEQLKMSVNRRKCHTETYEQIMISMIRKFIFILFYFSCACRAYISYSEMKHLLQLTNDQRASVGSRPLKLNQKLMKGAENYSVTLAGMSHIQHVNFEGRMDQTGFNGNRFGENIGMTQGNGPDIAYMHSLWVNSPGHRKNIEDPEFTHIGFGLYHDGNKFYYTQIFGSSKTETSITLTPKNNKSHHKKSDSHKNKKDMHGKSKRVKSKSPESSDASCDVPSLVFISTILVLCFHFTLA